MAKVADLIVIGAGLAGLTAAWQAAAAGKSVRVIAKGWGATHWHAGCLDVLALQENPGDKGGESLANCVADLIVANPAHPYALAGLERIDQALRAIQQLCDESGYPLPGSLERNWSLPSAVGAFRQTCLAPKTMIAGDLRQPKPMLIVGFKELDDFFPNLAAANLREQGIEARGTKLALESLAARRYLNPVGLVTHFEEPSFRLEVASHLKPQLAGIDRVGFPAVFGLKHPLEVMADLESHLQVPVFEIPTLPPSVPGMRLHKILANAIRQNGGQIFEGMEAVGAEAENCWVNAIFTEAAARRRRLEADNFVLATGGILGGGFVAKRNGRLQETVFDLPVDAPADRSEWLRQDYFDPLGHPLFSSGINTDRHLRPTDGQGQLRYRNLYAAGTVLAHHDGIRERSMEGVALVSGYLAGREVGAHETG